MFLLGITLLAGLGLTVRLGIHNIVLAETRKKYQHWTKINKLLTTRHESKCKIFLKTLKFTGKLIYLAILQYLNSSVLKIGYNTYMVKYLIAGKMYKMIIKPKRGPAPVLQVIDDLGFDVTNEVLPYMGPNFDWHHNRDLNFEEVFDSTDLTFNMASGDAHTGVISADIIV